MSFSRLALLAFGLATFGCGADAPPAHDHSAGHDKAPAPAPAEAKPQAAPLVGTLEGAKATHVMEGQVRAMPPGSAATGAFFILHNPSEHPAVVVGGSSPAAKAVELHTHVEEDGQFKMRQIDRIEVPAGEQVVLEPGGLHVMLIGPTQDLTEGETVSLTLQFQSGHSQAFDLPVKTIAAGSGGHAGHGGGTGKGGGHGAGKGHSGGHHGHKKADADPHAGHH